MYLENLIEGHTNYVEAHQRKTIVRRSIRNDSPEEAGEPREALVVFVQSIHHRLEPFCGGQDLIAGNLRHGILSGDWASSHLYTLPNGLSARKQQLGYIYIYLYICTRPCHPPPPPMGWVPYTGPIWDLPLPPLCGTVPLPPCGVVGVWYGMLGMYGVYGRSGMACLESMVCLVCMVGMVYMACMFAIVCMVGVVITFHMYGMYGMYDRYDRYDRYGMHGIIDMYGRYGIC